MVMENKKKATAANETFLAKAKAVWAKYDAVRRPLCPANKSPTRLFLFKETWEATRDFPAILRACFAHACRAPGEVSAEAWNTNPSTLGPRPSPHIPQQSPNPKPLHQDAQGEVDAWDIKEALKEMGNAVSEEMIFDMIKV